MLPLTLGAAVISTIAFLQAQAPQEEPNVAQRLAADLTWTEAESESRFGAMDRVFPVQTVAHGKPTSLPLGRTLPLQLGSGESLDSFVQRNRLAGVLVLQRGQVRVERYGLASTPQTRWASFSVTKAFTDALVGFALRDGKIRSADDPVTRYVPELAGSGYDGVTVRQLVTMTSGVRWREDYVSADADNVRLYAEPVAPGRDRVVEYMRRLPRESAPGTKWAYKTGETDLLGVLVRRAVGMPLSAYLARTLWRDMGAEADATWIAEGGSEFGGSGLSATLRDFGRFGEYVRTHRQSGWFAEATRTAVAVGDAGHGYGYGWWTYPDGSFAALGIFGQSILVDPRRELVIVTLAAWPEATSPALAADREALWAAVRQAVDAE